MSVFAASSAIVLTSSPLLSAWHGMVNLARFAELSLCISLNAKLFFALDSLSPRYRFPVLLIWQQVFAIQVHPVKYKAKIPN